MLIKGLGGGDNPRHDACGISHKGVCDSPEHTSASTTLSRSSTEYRMAPAEHGEVSMFGLLAMWP